MFRTFFFAVKMKTKEVCDEQVIEVFILTAICLKICDEISACNKLIFHRVSNFDKR